MKTGKRGRGERRKERVTENSYRDGNNFRRERDRARMGARAREIGRRRRRSSPPASPRDGNSVALEGARRRERGRRSSPPASSPRDGNSVSLSLTDRRPRSIGAQTPLIDRGVDLLTIDLDRS